MSAPKQSRRKVGTKKLEPIDWHEFANDAVLNGNMSTLYHRPASEDPTAYASPEALVEIEKRVGRPAQSAVVVDLDSPHDFDRPTVGTEPTVGTKPIVGAESDVAAASPVDEIPTVGLKPTVGVEPDASVITVVVKEAGPTVGIVPTVGLKESPEVAVLAVVAAPTAGLEPTVGLEPDAAVIGAIVEEAKPTVGLKPTVDPGESVGPVPTVGSIPTVGLAAKRKVKPIRDVQDALTLAGQVLYKAMYGAPDGARSKPCTKGYRQLAAETHLDKDTVRDLISEFKEKGILRETGTYDPDTRSAKTYEVLSYKAILQAWRDAGLAFVTTGRRRPMFCSAEGQILPFTPTVGPKPTVSSKPTVGLGEGVPGLLQALQQITGSPVDQEAADRLIRNCRAEAPDCTTEEIVEFAWSKAFLCRSGKIENPIGFLIAQIPKHFQGEALQAYRESKRQEVEVAAALAAREEQRRQEAEREITGVEQRQQMRSRVAEQHRREQGIDLKGLLEDSAADDILKEWARRMLRLGYHYQAAYE